MINNMFMTEKEVLAWIRGNEEVPPNTVEFIQWLYFEGGAIHPPLKTYIAVLEARDK